MQINSNLWNLKAIFGRDQRSSQWSSQQLSWMRNDDHLIRI